METNEADGMRIEAVVTATELTIAWLRSLVSATSRRGCRMSEHESPQQRPTQAARPLRILVENSEYWLRNYGDLAMLAVALDRMHQRWPDARIAFHLGSAAAAAQSSLVLTLGGGYLTDADRT
jgi:hypothetical protein